jgi:hypothetical protein
MNPTMTLQSNPKARSSAITDESAKGQDMPSLIAAYEYNMPAVQMMKASSAAIAADATRASMPRLWPHAAIALAALNSARVARPLTKLCIDRRAIAKLMATQISDAAIATRRPEPGKYGVLRAGGPATSRFAGGRWPAETDASAVEFSAKGAPASVTQGI